MMYKSKSVTNNSIMQLIIPGTLSDLQRFLIMFLSL